MNRIEYKNNHIKEHYDRITLCVPKGDKTKIKACADKLGISVNQYIVLLLTVDMNKENTKPSNTSKAEYTELLDKWQIAQKYREMIDSIDVDEINGMNKHYTIILKNGYINDITGNNTVYACKMKDIRRIIVKSHKIHN